MQRTLLGVGDRSSIVRINKRVIYICDKPIISHVYEIPYCKKSVSPLKAPNFYFLKREREREREIERERERI